MDLGRRRRHGLRKLAFAGVLLAGAGAMACAGGCRHEGEAEPQARSTPRLPGQRASSQGSGAPAPRVGNTDPSGVGNQPDWDEMARDLRARVGPRLPERLPENADAACREMLDAAVTFYSTTEPNPSRRRARLDELAATREEDLRGCTVSTSVEAAACVTVLLGDRDSEFPWLLDQCTRAYPKSG